MLSFLGKAGRCTHRCPLYPLPKKDAWISDEHFLKKIFSKLSEISKDWSPLFGGNGSKVYFYSMSEEVNLHL
jgi:hypothetical protein